MDRERISRLEALLARVKARVEEPRAHANGEVQESRAPEETLLTSDDLESLPPPPVLPRPEVTIPTRPAFMPMAALQAERRHGETPPPPPEPVAEEASAAGASASSLEEAFEQYELESEVVEIAADTDDDAVRPSVRPPVMIDAEFEAIAKHEAERADADSEASEHERAPVYELHSQQRLVAATPYSEATSGVDSGELEVVGETDLEDDVMDADTDDLIEQFSLDARQVSALDADVEPSSDVAPSSNRPTREMSAILESGFEAPPDDANRPVLELQDEEPIEEPPPSSRRPVSHEEVREAELTFENELPQPPLTPPPESGPQVALPVHADLRGNPEVAEVISPREPASSSFGDLLDEALTL